jgi:hypothetical protein
MVEDDILAAVIAEVKCDPHAEDMNALGLAAADVSSIARRPRDGASYTILKPGPMHVPEQERFPTNISSRQRKERYERSKNNAQKTDSE